jgi:hypothetical protein
LSSERLLFYASNPPQRIRKPQSTTYSSSTAICSSQDDQEKDINTGLSSRLDPTSLLLISTNILTSIHSIQTTSASQHQKTPNNQHAFHSDFHPQGPDQPRRLLRRHVNDPRSLPNGARARVDANSPVQTSAHQRHKHLLASVTTFKQQQRYLARPSPLAAARSQQPNHPDLSTPRSDLPVATAA